MLAWKSELRCAVSDACARAGTARDEKQLQNYVRVLFFAMFGLSCRSASECLAHDTASERPPTQALGGVRIKTFCAPLFGASQALADRSGTKMSPKMTS